MVRKGKKIDERTIQRINRIMEDYDKTIITHVDKEYERKTSFGDRLADRIACFGGSWKFIIIFAGFLTIWIVWNVLPFTYHIDPSSFILIFLKMHGCIPTYWNRFQKNRTVAVENTGFIIMINRWIAQNVTKYDTLCIYLFDS